MKKVNLAFKPFRVLVVVAHRNMSCGGFESLKCIKSILITKDELLFINQSRSGILAVRIRESKKVII